MNTKLLKQKILDLAIRGKLTDQRKSDGNTADLLKEISSACHPERCAKGAKSKDLKQIIPLDKSEAPFEIPENWEWVRLGDVAYIASGSTPSKDCFVESGVPYLKMYNLRNQQIDFEYKPQYIKREVHEGKLARSKAKPGDVIMNIVGPPLGKVALVPESLPECNFNQAAVLIRAHFCTNLMNQYIRYFLLQMDEINAINTKGTAGQENISLTQTQNMRLPLPPLAEQQRIVAKIEEAFAEIDAIEKNKELLKTHIKQTRQKILDLAIHGKLVPQNKSDEPASVLLERITRDNPHYEKIEDEPFEIPENWIWARINDINFFQSNTENPMLEGNKNRTYELYSVPCFEAKYPEIVKGTEIGSTKVLVNKGDVLISKINPHLNRVWCVPQFTEHRMIASSEWIIIRNPEINQSYLVYVLQSGYFLDKMLSNTSGVGGSLTRAKPYEVKKYEIPLPPLAEQSRIVTKIEELFSALDHMERNLV